MSEVAAAAEEAGEEIERVMLAGLTTLFVLVEAIVPVLVVDAPGFCRGEGVVGFGYRNEFVMGGVVTSVSFEISAQWEPKLRRRDCQQNLRTNGFLSGWYFLLSVRYARLISLSDADLSMSNSL